MICICFNTGSALGAKIHTARGTIYSRSVQQREIRTYTRARSAVITSEVHYI